MTRLWGNGKGMKMKIVIDIPENIIESAKSSPNYYPIYCFEMIWKAIVNRTPLPKGHGRLIDADAYVRNVVKMPRINTKTIGLALQETPTIIEADKGEE
jgi:hypothetical protein